MPPVTNDTGILNADVSASRTPLYLTFALMLFGFGSISSARVAFSLYALDLGASASAVGILVAALYVFPLLISWPVGRYSDRVGSRWLLLLGAACGGGALCGCDADGHSVHPVQRVAAESGRPPQRTARACTELQQRKPCGRNHTF